MAETQEHLIPLSIGRKEINAMTWQYSGYFSTSFSAMSVDGMYQGCIMRNMRTWEASFNVPDSSKIKKQKSCSWIHRSTITTQEGSTVARREFSLVNLTLIQWNMFRWPTEGLDALFQQLIHCCRLLQRHGLHCSSLSVSSLVFLLTGCVALDREKEGMKRSN